MRGAIVVGNQLVKIGLVTTRLHWRINGSCAYASDGRNNLDARCTDWLIQQNWCLVDGWGVIIWRTVHHNTFAVDVTVKFVP